MKVGRDGDVVAEDKWIDQERKNEKTGRTWYKEGKEKHQSD